MPKDKEVKEKSAFLLKLEERREQGQAQAIADIVREAYIEHYSKMVNGRPIPETEEKINDITAFLMETIKNPHYREEMKLGDALIDAFSRNYYEDAVILGKKRDQLVKDIRAGKVKGTELIADEMDTPSKLARNIILEREPAANAGIDCYLKCAEAFVGLKFGKLGGEEYYEQKGAKSHDEIQAKYGLTDGEMDSYVTEFVDRNPSTSIEYVIKTGPLAEGESLFSKLPANIERLNSLKSVKDLDAYEEELCDKLYDFEINKMRVKSATKLMKGLYDELKDISKGMELSEDHQKTLTKAETFTHLGKDYILDDENIPKEYIKPEENITPALVNNATVKLMNPADIFAEATFNKFDGEKNLANVSEEVKRHNKKIAANAECISNLNFCIKEKNDKFIKAKYSTSDYNKDKSDLAYINKFRKQKGLFAREEAVVDSYTDHLDKKVQEICDNITNDVINDECYDKLMKSILHRKRLYTKLVSAENAGNLEARDKALDQLSNNTEHIKEVVSQCREFEKTNKTKFNINGKSVGREKLLSGLEKDSVKELDTMKERKLPESFNTYIGLHTGKRAGKTDKELCENLAKIMGAYTLKAVGQKFSVKTIHKAAKELKKFYCIDENSPGFSTEKLTEALKNKDTALKYAEKVRQDMFGLKGDCFDNFVTDMTILSESMRPEKGRSDEYKELCNAIKEAAKLPETIRHMSSRDKKIVITQANCNVVVAVQKYVKGKEKVRMSDKGNDAFLNSMDALAIVSKYTKKEGMVINESIAHILDGIDAIRHDNTISIKDRFQRTYGAKRAKEAYNNRILNEMEKKAPKNNKKM